MANFRTHRNVGIATSIGTTIILNQYTNINVETLFLMLISGTIASIFPDIDLKTSKPFQFLKILLYLFLPAFLICFLFYNPHIANQFKHLNFETLSVIVFLSSLVISWIFLSFLSSFMVHRGLIHSVPFALLSSIVIYELFKLAPHEVNSLFISILWFTGFITHLLLDEMYSVNLENETLSKSFGTALSLIKFKNLLGSFILYGILVIYIDVIDNYNFINKVEKVLKVH